MTDSTLAGVSRSPKSEQLTLQLEGEAVPHRAGSEIEAYPVVHYAEAGVRAPGEAGRRKRLVAATHAARSRLRKNDKLQIARKGVGDAILRLHDVSIGAARAFCVPA
jgi:hypothetical protein